jgi:hypothetical protein
MPLGKVQLQPGIQGMQSPTAAEGGWAAGNLVRFRQGLPEKWRGWTRYLPDPLEGAVRGMVTVYELAGDAVLGVGTSDRLYMLRGQVAFEITPIDRSIATAAGGIATTLGSPVVGLTFATDHGFRVGDILTFDTIVDLNRTPSGLAVGGISLSGRDFHVDTVPSSTTLTFTGGSAATAGATGAGTVTAFMATGSEDATPGLGWGAGPYGMGGYNQPASISPTALLARMWSLEPWGQTLLACPTQGRISAWSPDNAGNVSARAAYVTAEIDTGIALATVTANGTGYTTAPSVTFSPPTGTPGRIAAGHAVVSGGAVTGIVIDDPGTGYTAPPTVTLGGPGTGATAACSLTTLFHGPPRRVGGIVVGMPERHAMAFGCSDLNSTANFDPLLIRFSDVENFTEWRPSATNSAGSFRLQGGGEIRAWLNSNLQTLVWTDTSLWVCRYVGLPYVYSFNKLDGNCGAISQNCRAELGGAVYWMGPNGFWSYAGGSPKQIQCSLQDDVFNALNRNQQAKVTAGVNTANGEILWFYPTSQEIDRFVAFNTREGTWYGGALARTVWLDIGPTLAPMAADPQGYLYLQEQGTDADGQPMGEWLESGYFDIEDGQNVLFVDRFIPDFQEFEGSLKLWIKTTEYPAKAPRVQGPFTITPSTRFVPFRARGRQAALRLEGGGLGSWWRWGAPRVNSQPDGMRG